MDNLQVNDDDNAGGLDNAEVQALAATVVAGGMKEKKTRKTPSHPPPLWKEDDWRLTRRLLSLLLEPSQDIIRRALWPRVGETPVGGSKIEYQTELARLTLVGWVEEAHVKMDDRWYGNRVKDWMHKLPKIYAECEKEVADAAAAQDVPVGEWVQNGRISSRCPVYRELQQLLGSAVGIPPLPLLPSYHVPHASTSAGDLSPQLSLDPSLNLVSPHLSVMPMTMPIAQCLEKIASKPNGHDRRRRLNDGSAINVGPSDGLELDWLTDSHHPKYKGLKRDRSILSDDESSSSSLDHVTPASAELCETRKLRKQEQHHERALRRDEMEHERIMAEMAEKEKVREREFELEKLRLQLALKSASGSDVSMGIEV
ncbi:hypothetical protein RQP46_001277 [Phenoliferia psychrophenolica]